MSEGSVISDLRWHLVWPGWDVLAVWLGWVGLIPGLAGLSGIVSVPVGGQALLEVSGVSVISVL